MAENEDNEIDAPYVTRKAMMKKWEAKHTRTIDAMIAAGNLPPFSVNRPHSKIKGWHLAVLERFHMERYERQLALR